MRLHDISLSLSPDLPTWPGDPPLELKKVSRIEDGELANVTRLSTSVHVGTHVDAPDHFLGNGDTVEKIPLDLLVGPARVIELSKQSSITANHLKSAGVSGKDQRLLIKTSNSTLWEQGIREFQEDFIALEADAAAYLVEIGLEVIGVDYLSVAPFLEPEPTHRILLEAGILVIEGLDLSKIEPGPYQLICLPLKIEGSDGAPARVLLQEG